jgi:hypothetical protein
VGYGRGGDAGDRAQVRPLCPREVQITSLGLGGVIALIVLVVAILAAFVPTTVELGKLLLVLVAALALARLV